MSQNRSWIVRLFAGIWRVVEIIRTLQFTGGGSYWKLSPLLLELAQSGRSFADWDREHKQGGGTA